MTILWLVTVVWTLSVSCVAGVALWRSRQPRAPWPQAPTPPYVLMRPCAGTETHLLDNLLSSQALRGAAPVCTVLGAETHDAALPTLLQACTQLRAGGHTTYVQATHSRAPNAKVAQLGDLTAGVAQHLQRRDAGGVGVLVYADSDVDLTDFPMTDLLAPLAQPEVAAVWAPFYEPTPTTLGDGASALLLGGSLHSFALLHQLDRDGVVGKVLAIKPAALADIGGWAGLGDVLGEDMELGRRLRAAAWRVVACGSCARARPSPRGLRATLERWRRWLWVVRAQRPKLMWSYPLLFCASVPLLGLCACLASGAPTWGLALTAWVMLVRWRVARGAQRLTQPRLRAPRWRQVPMLLLRCLATDALLLVAWCGILGRRRVRWRARTLHIDLRGRMHESMG